MATSKRKITTITLPEVRARQLRLIAKARSLTIGDLIARFIESEISVGIIADEIPGIAIRATRGLIELEVGGTKIRLDVASAKKFAKELGGVARPRSTVFYRGKNVNHYDPFVIWQNKEQDARLQAYRRGRGLILEIQKGRHVIQEALNESVGLSIARLIRKKAREASEQ